MRLPTLLPIVYTSADLRAYGAKHMMCTLEIENIWHKKKSTFLLGFAACTFFYLYPNICTRHFLSLIRQHVFSFMADEYRVFLSVSLFGLLDLKLEREHDYITG